MRCTLSKSVQCAYGCCRKWLYEASQNLSSFKEGACILFFHPKTRPKTRPKTFLQRFALEQRKHKAKHCINVLRRVLGQKIKIQMWSFRQLLFLLFYRGDQREIFKNPAKTLHCFLFYIKSWNLMASIQFVEFELPCYSIFRIVKPNEGSAWALGACKQLSHNLLSSLLSQATAHPYPQ